METIRRERPREDIDGDEETKSLPPEIITEILLRLPAKSVGRFRCVSKLFRSLSSNTGFAKSHLDLTLRNDSPRSVHRKLIVSSHNLFSLDLDSISDEVERSEDLAAVELNYPLKDEPSVFDEMIRSYVKEYMFGGCGSEIIDDDNHRAMLKLKARSYRRNWVEIIGSSYGLVCISPSEDAVFLYNPTTGESKRLPETLRPTIKEHGEQFQTYGFGFDDLANDYKVVKLLANGDNALIAIVYSLKTDSWRHVCDLSYEHSDSFNSGLHFNYSIHWVFTRSQSKRFVVSYNLKTDEIREMPLPDEAEDCPHRFRNFIVGNFNGLLCVVNNCYEIHDDIWVMNEYGEANSWSRIRISLLYRSIKPLCSITHNKDVLLELDGDMVLYNFKTDSSKNLRIRGVKLSDGFEANTYVESLISPNSWVIES